MGREIEMCGGGYLAGKKDKDGLWVAEGKHLCYFTASKTKKLFHELYTLWGDFMSYVAGKHLELVVAIKLEEIEHVSIEKYKKRKRAIHIIANGESYHVVFQETDEWFVYLVGVAAKNAVAKQAEGESR